MCFSFTSSLNSEIGTTRKEEQFCLDSKWCFAYCMTLFFYAVIVFQEETFQKGILLSLFSGEESGEKSHTVFLASTLLWYGMVWHGLAWNVVCFCLLLLLLIFLLNLLKIIVFLMEYICCGVCLFTYYYFLCFQLNASHRIVDRSDFVFGADPNFTMTLLFSINVYMCAAICLPLCSVQCTSKVHGSEWKNCKVNLSINYNFFLHQLPWGWFYFP